MPGKNSSPGSAKLSAVTGLIFGAAMSIMPAQAQVPTPAYPDAKWGQDGCAQLSYQMRNSENQLAQLRADLAERQQSTTEPPLTADILAQVDDAIDALQKDITRKTGNIAGCTGIFSRVDVLDACQQLAENVNKSRREVYDYEEMDYLTESPFCSTLNGGTFKEVQLVDDPVAFRKSVAWNFWGLIADRKTEFIPTNWTFSPTPEQEMENQPEDCVRSTTSQFTDTLSCLDGLEAYQLKAIADSMHTEILTGTIAVAEGQDTSDERGSTRTMIELVRKPEEDITDSERAFLIAQSEATGIPWDLGPYVQSPVIHFQSRMYDILLEGSDAVLYAAVSDAAGDGYILHQIAAATPGKYVAGKSFFTSWDSMRVHARFQLGADQWEAVLAPETAALYILVGVIGEDGEPTVFEVSIPTQTLPAALATFTAAQSEVRASMTEIVRKTDLVRAQTEERRQREQTRFTAELAALNSEGLRAVADLKTDWPIAFNCSVPSLISTNASTAIVAQFNNDMNTARQCVDAWQRRRGEFYQDVVSLKSRYKLLQSNGRHDVYDQLNAYEALWTDQSESARSALRQRNDQIESRNAQIARNEQDNASYETSYRRNTSRDDGPERDYAQEFYESQRNPPPTNYPYIEPPRPPTYYLSPGYN